MARSRGQRCPLFWKQGEIMTIREVIAQVDSTLANTYTQREKIRWLSQLDHRVKVKIIDTHEGAENVCFDGYDENTDPDTKLLVPAPFDEMYLRWLEAQIHYANQEEDRCNNATDSFDVLYAEYRNYYNQQHMPLGHKLRF